MGGQHTTAARCNDWVLCYLPGVRSLSRWIPLLALLACAGQHAAGQSPEALKKAAETFFRQVRWRDYTGASELVVPEKRDAFSKARRTHHDERDLEITDYDLEQVKVAPDALTGEVVTSMSWTRLPSVTVQSAEVGTDFVYRDGRWLVLRMDGGPFEELR